MRGARRRAAAVPPHRRFGQVTWYRLALPELSDVDRAVYLDSDLIVLDDLRPLFTTELGSSVVAAVTNTLYPGVPFHGVSELGLRSERDYFNAGVLLLDLEAWRTRGVTDQIVASINTGLGGLAEGADQHALNSVLWHERVALHPRWNAQNPLFELADRQLPLAAEEIGVARRDPAIVHFIGPYKPWHHRSKHPYRARYFEHLAATPWATNTIDSFEP